MKRNFNLWVAGFVLVAFVIFAASALADDERGTLVSFKGVSESILSRTSPWQEALRLSLSP
jgi:hypothetical protein